MSNDALKTLFHPFETGDLPLPETGARILFLGAEAGFLVPEGFVAELSCVQGFRPAFLALQSSGLKVAPQIEGDDFDSALILCNRHRGENENRIADALEKVRPGGTILVAGGKEEGIASLRKRVAGLTPLDGNLAKYHGGVFWFRRDGDIEPLLDALRSGNGPVRVEDRFVTAPGMFSYDRVDKGSRLLAETVPSDFSGHVADFCAGWGFLSAELLRRAPGIKAIDLHEADFASLEAARINLSTAAQAAFFWRDLLSEPVTEKYAAIIMNPPFHNRRNADPLIGQDMVKTAAGALRRGGQLWMVANVHLPYETTLNAQFGSHREHARENGFKVLSASR
ncbi:methyltransferase [Mesorhizobium sp. NBSH29]|uniref:class I SAM-dependent methyltransferase n=1 Tax=Mesorhizobium sp. NBSH29 TaxID=2654249 RepID=UPI0018967798|nr:class I SAM-dependent methyltransferase [Mesorhizobium sp. NBSH29]QPC86530.1 methyltransferase [Mesorhizobium sp. NBSH29]